MMIKATEFTTASEAIQWSEAEGGEAVLLSGRNFVMSKDEAERIAAKRISFAYLGVCRLADEREIIVTIPVN